MLESYPTIPTVGHGILFQANQSSQILECGNNFFTSDVFSLSDITEISGTCQHVPDQMVRSLTFYNLLSKFMINFFFFENLIKETMHFCVG
jgi:hypothetical protein